MDGRVQFAFVKVKDPNTSLPKHVLVGWCGAGVPERTKGYFTNYQAATAKVLHVSCVRRVLYYAKLGDPQGYHVQITARTDQDLSPEGIVQKVADASGAKYSTGDPVKAPSQSMSASSKPVFMPTSSAGGAVGFNRSRDSNNVGGSRQDDLDNDGWGKDAPPVTRTQLQKVEPAYKPTRVNMSELNRQQEPSSSGPVSVGGQFDRPDVVKGSYKPVGKVDIAAIRKEAQNAGSAVDDRPTSVKGAYEPIGKVDIAAIRARAQQQPIGTVNESTEASLGASNQLDMANSQSRSLADRSAAFSRPERLTSLPKPKVPNRFVTDTSTFAGTKAPLPGEFGLGSKVSPKAAPTGASRTFADEGGKTPAQLWAEKKAKQGVSSGILPTQSSGESFKSPTASQSANSGEWKSGYTGKSWAPVQTTKTGRSATSADQDPATNEDEGTSTADHASASGLGSIRDRFNEAPIMGAGAIKATTETSASPPPLDNSNKPNAGRGVPIPGLQQQPPERGSDMPVPPPPQPRSPTPPTPVEDEESPIRVAMPVSRNVPEIEDARDEQSSPPPSMPTTSLSQEASRHQETSETEAADTSEAARIAATTVAASSFDDEAVTSAPAAGSGIIHAVAQYDYEKAEDNELELREGEQVTNIEMVDEDWWMGQNSRGETGLFPSNYVEVVEERVADGASIGPQEQQPAAHESAPEAGSNATTLAGTKGLPTATALYDYEAGEDNELTFPENAKITNVVCSIFIMLTATGPRY